MYLSAYSMLCISTLGCVYCLCAKNCQYILQILILLTETAKLGYTCKLCTCLHPVKTTSLLFPCSGHSHAWIYIYIARISSKSSESITLITSHALGFLGTRVEDKKCLFLYTQTHISESIMVSHLAMRLIRTLPYRLKNRAVMCKCQLGIQLKRSLHMEATLLNGCLLLGYCSWTGQLSIAVCTKLYKTNQCTMVHCLVHCSHRFAFEFSLKDY